MRPPAPATISRMSDMSLSCAAGIAEARRVGKGTRMHAVPTRNVLKTWTPIAARCFAQPAAQGEDSGLRAVVTLDDDHIARRMRRAQFDRRLIFGRVVAGERRL